jgi:hypothetical protein
MKKSSLSIVWTVFLTFSLMLSVLDIEQMHKNLLIVQKIDVWIVLQNIVCIVIVVATSFWLMKLHPVFKFSLFSIFNYKKEKETGGVTGQNINVMPYKIRYFGIIFVLLLLLNFPYYAYLEETLFREGITNWQEGILWSCIFGFTHCLVGVPVAAGAALSLAGVWFTHQYMQGGVDLSTVHHTSYNMTIGVLLLVYTIISAFEK